MIVTVTLNPCVHHILAHETPAGGRIVVKPVRSFFQAGGKGLNAARVAASLGADVLALTTWGDTEGKLMLREVEYSGVRVNSVEISRPTRISTCVYNMTENTFIELLEPGVELTGGEVEGYYSLFLESLDGAGTVALNGSSPCRATDDFFRRACVAAREKGCTVMVDTYGDSLVNAVKSAPHMVKLNIDEIRISFGFDVDGQGALFAFARRLMGGGIEHVLITDGARGAWLFTAEGALRIHVPPVRELHPIGSGDAMMGAIVARMERGDELAEACRWGAAAGAVNASRLEVCQFSRNQVEELLPSVTIEAITV